MKKFIRIVGMTNRIIVSRREKKLSRASVVRCNFPTNAHAIELSLLIEHGTIDCRLDIDVEKCHASPESGKLRFCEAYIHAFRNDELKRLS
jgi:hypothetical protein